MSPRRQLTPSMDEATFALAQKQLSNLDDPLTIYLDHWQYLSVSKKQMAMLPFLEMATRQFIDDPRYRNDPRYLRLWLEYAKRCKDPEDIFLFLEMKQVATGLAAYYEEYSGFLEKNGQSFQRIDGIYRLGISRQARPLERLQASHREFLARHEQKPVPHPSQGRHSWSAQGETAPMAWTGKPSGARQEIPSYDPRLIQGGVLSFEEVRAEHYHQRRRPLTVRSIQPQPAVINLMDCDDDDNGDGLDGVPGAIMVNPDDLTHVSVYRENTADLRELSAQLAKSNAKVSEPSSVENQPQSVQTHVSFLPDPFAAAEARARQIEAQVATYRPSKLQMVSESALSKLRALDRIIGRDGSGPNQTVSALRLPGCGHFFIEGRLANNIYLAVDLEADSSHPVALKAISPPSLWESLLLDRIHQQLDRLASLLPPTCLESLHASFPRIDRLCMFNDVLFQVETLYPLGCLARLPPRLDEVVALFFARELIRILMVLMRVGIVHGRLVPEHVLVRTAEVESWSSRFQPDGSAGWSTRGLALCGLSRAMEGAQYEQDWLAAWRLMEGWLEEGRSATHACWNDIRTCLTSPQQGAAQLEGLLAMVESVLTEASVQSKPSLKALLTRMEIELMEK